MRLTQNYHRMMRFVEEVCGIGDLMLNGAVLRQVQYRISRFQGMNEGSGLPVPGLHQIEGTIDFDSSKDPCEWIGTPLSLKLEDGRVIAITLVGSNGRILNEGHGPAKCQFCHGLLGATEDGGFNPLP